MAASATLSAALGVEAVPSRQTETADAEAVLRDRLGEAEFERTWAEGSALSLEQAVAEALVAPTLITDRELSGAREE